MKNVLERTAENKTDEKIRYFKAKQAESYEFKVRYAEIRAWEFYNHPDINGSCYVAVGGLDSLTLLLFLRSIGINVPAVSVSVLEDKSIQAIHKQLGVEPLKPLKSKVEVIREFGWPVLSKEIAGKINLLQNPSEKNATVRHAIITGETGAYGGYRKGTRMKLSQKWLEKFGGYENENEGVSYRTPDFFVSDKCCYYLKERPCDDYARSSGRFPYHALPAHSRRDDRLEQAIQPQRILVREALQGQKLGRQRHPHDDLAVHGQGEDSQEAVGSSGGYPLLLE